MVIPKGIPVGCGAVAGEGQWAGSSRNMSGGGIGAGLFGRYQEDVLNGALLKERGVNLVYRKIISIQNEDYRIPADDDLRFNGQGTK